MLLAMLVVVSLLVSAPPARAAVPGANGEIAFTSNRDGQDDVYVMNPDGSDVRRLTTSGGSEPAWSPDGLFIAYVSGEDIFVVDAAGGQHTRLTFGGPADPSRSPAWSVDGARIAFERDRNIWVMQADGSGQSLLVDRAVTPPPSSTSLTVNGVFDPSWSPDGATLTMTQGFLGPTPLASSSRLVKTDTAAAGPITVIGETSQRSAASDWAPNGSQIAFEDDFSPFGQVAVRLVGSDGTGTTALAGSLLPSTGHPSWSPDGTMLAIEGSMSFLDSADDIYVIGSDGAGLVNLTNGMGVNQQPDWQPRNTIPYGLVDPATGRWHLRGAGGTARDFFYGNPGDTPVMGDWNCDGTDTPGLFRTSDAFAYLRNSNTQGIADVRFFFGDPADVPLAGDFDGDGCDTLSIYRPGEQRFYIVNELGQNEGGLGPAEFFFDFGDPGDKPVVGDWDGDGIDEVGLHRESTGFFYWRNTLDSGIASGQIFFGDPGDRFITGDWTGDGLDTVALLRPGDGRIYVRNTNTQGIADSVFVTGANKSTWVPVSGSFGFA